MPIKIWKKACSAYPEDTKLLIFMFFELKTETTDKLFTIICFHQVLMFKFNETAF